jgi:hypothetical protein
MYTWIAILQRNFKLNGKHIYKACKNDTFFLHFLFLCNKAVYVVYVASLIRKIKDIIIVFIT